MATRGTDRHFFNFITYKRASRCQRHFFDFRRADDSFIKNYKMLPLVLESTSIIIKFASKINFISRE